MKIVEPSVELLYITPQPAQLLESAGRTCYKSEDKITDNSAAKFVKMICKNKHESVLEHAVASFRIVTDRGVSHEIVRHRLFSYSQESTRYVNYGKDKHGGEITVIMASSLASLKGSGVYDELEFWKDACVQAELNYLDMLEYGAAPQTARALLPTCLKTELVMTGNFRNWRHFIAMRSSKTAHPDVQLIANLLQDVLIKECPEVFA